MGGLRHGEENNFFRIIPKCKVSFTEDCFLLFGHALFFFFSMQAMLPLVIGQFPFVGCFWLRDYLTVADVMDMILSKLREMVRDWKAWCAAAHEVEKSWTCLGD